MWKSHIWLEIVIIKKWNLQDHKKLFSLIYFSDGRKKNIAFGGIKKQSHFIVLNYNLRLNSQICSDSKTNFNWFYEKVEHRNLKVSEQEEKRNTKREKKFNCVGEHSAKIGYISSRIYIWNKEIFIIFP